MAAPPPPPPGVPPPIPSYPPSPYPAHYPGSPYGVYGAAPPGWPSPPAAPHGTGTRESIRLVRDSISYFWVVLWLNLIATIISGVALGVNFAGGAGLLSSTGSVQLNHPAVTGAAGLGLSAIGGLLLLAVLILTIYSWVKWREASSDLARWSAEFGPGPMAMAQRARRDVSNTTYMFIALVVMVIVFAVALTAIVFAALAGQIRLNNTSAVAPTFTLSSGVLLELRIAAAVLLVVETLLLVLLVGFATRSHVETIAPYAGPDVRRLADSGRKIAVLGVMANLLGIAGLFVPYGSALGILGGVLLVYGFYQIRGSFDLLLAKPLEAHPAAPPVRGLPF